jgi:flagellar protein FliS
MNPSQLAKSYRAMAINTATPGQLILMLYDGALGAMAVALDGFQIDDHVRRNEQIHNSLVKAQSIIRELQFSLDMKVPGGFSQRMWALYDYYLRQLTDANIRKDPEPIRVVERLLGTIRNAWAEMLNRTTANAA